MSELTKVFQKFSGKEIALQVTQTSGAFKGPSVFTPDFNDALMQEIFKTAAKHNIYINIVYPVPTKQLTPSESTRQVNMHLHMEKDEKGQWPKKGTLKIVGFTQA